MSLEAGNQAKIQRILNLGLEKTTVGGSLFLRGDTDIGGGAVCFPSARGSLSARHPETKTGARPRAPPRGWLSLGTPRTPRATEASACFFLFSLQYK